MLRTSISKIKENSFELTKKRSRSYPEKTITNADYANDIAILATAPTQAETPTWEISQQYSKYLNQILKITCIDLVMLLYSQNEETATLVYENITLFFVTMKWSKWLHLRERQTETETEGCYDWHHMETHIFRVSQELLGFSSFLQIYTISSPILRYIFQNLSSCFSTWGLLFKTIHLVYSADRFSADSLVII